MVIDGADLDAALLAHLARDRIFEALARLDKAGQGRIHAGREMPRAAHQRLVAMGHQHDDRRVGAREMHRVAGRVGAAPHMPGLLAPGRAAAQPAKAVARMPVEHRAGQRQQRRLARVEPSGQLAQIGKAHDCRVDPTRRKRRRMQHVERRFERRQIEREMRALLDDPDKHHLAAAEPLLGGAGLADQRAEPAPAQHHRARLAAIDLENQVLVAPDRDKEARRVGEALDDPGGSRRRSPARSKPGAA